MIAAPKDKKDKTNSGRPKWTKPYFLLPIIFLVLLSLIFILWQLSPKKELNICLIDKTVPAADDNNVSDVSAFYRKHQGFYWLLEQQKYVKADKSFYNYKTDYFGPMLDEYNNVSSIKGLSQIDFKPDLMYIADVYGSELDGRENKGLTADDLSTVSLAHSNGATIIAEMELYNSTGDANVLAQINKLCGIEQTKWVGRYIYELQDFSDVPYWAPPMYEQQEGVEWRLSGPGVLLVSNEGRILVFEEKTHFVSKNLLTISINEEYKKEFSSCGKNINFYNWFELIEVDYSTETLATFTFDFNAEGMEKFSEVSKYPRFSAVARKTYTDKEPVYYFAGDFNDYVSKENYNRFLFADEIYRLISYDRSGDISKFYWNFYNPLMKEILKDVHQTAKRNKYSANEEANNEQKTRLTNNRFEVKNEGEWAILDLKGFNINGIMPGGKQNAYSRDFSAYEQMINLAVQAGANCIRAYDVLPPEFYRAVYENNRNSESKKIYIIQSIKAPDNIAVSQYATEDGRETLHKNIEKTVKTIHGDLIIDQTSTSGGSELAYLHDVSTYLLGYIIDIDLSSSEAEQITAQTPDYKYEGAAFSASGNTIEAMLAELCQYLYDYHIAQYDYKIPIGVLGNAQLILGVPGNTDIENSYSPDNISVSADISDSGFFTALHLMPNDKALLDNKAAYSAYTDDKGVFPYGGYIAAIKDKMSNHPVLIDKVGLSTHTNSFEKDSEVNGLSEQEQGNGIVRMLKAIEANNFVGGLIGDLNDGWGNYSDEMYPYTVPISNNSMWHNMLDSEQNSGIIAAEVLQPDEVGMEINDSGRMQQIRISSNEAYVYLSILMKTEIDYDKEQLFIGVDTFQRNDGEYLYDKNYFANSLSGMEFAIKFDSKTSAGLYVTRSYNRSQGGYSPKETYTSDFDLLFQMVHGNFSSSDTHFYQTGSTINIRLPWSALGFCDPSQKIVMNHLGDSNFVQVSTNTTDGMMFSLCVAEKATKDTLYIFPENKQSTGYKSYKWNAWEDVNYKLRPKSSYNIIRNYFSGN